MKRNRIYILTVPVVLILSSCATMFNSKTTDLIISSSIPASFIINTDTINNSTKNAYISVARDNKPLIVTAFNDTISKTVTVKPHSSFAYWLNAYPNLHLWTGFWIDTKTQKRFAYPKTIYIDLQKRDSAYLRYIPLDDPYGKYLNIVKFTPLKILGTLNPGVEIAYERKLNNSFSTQVMASYLLPISLWNIKYDFRPNIKGYRFAIEEKFYWQNSAPMGPYLSLEFNYLRNQYYDEAYFGVALPDLDSNNNYLDTYGIKKRYSSINLKIGYQYVVKRLTVDIYCGLGIRYRDVVHFDRINPEDEMEIPGSFNIYYNSIVSGKYWEFCIPLNMRLGWTF